jgi:hypothetical protein
MTRSAFRSSLIALVLAAVGAVGAAPASAIQIGISEQNGQMFYDPLFAPLHIHYARLVVPWNIAESSARVVKPYEQWFAGATLTGVEPHVAFNAVGYRRNPKGPTPAQYARAVAMFHHRWPAVRVFSAWNEENHYIQPTAKNPKLAASYYKILRRVCPTCQVVAADMLDDANLASWLKQFLKYTHGTPRLWGLHNYQDVNHHRKLSQSWTLKLTRMVKGTIWSTEAGGIVSFRAPSGKTVYPYSPTRAAANLKYLLQLMANPLVRSRYQRTYIYNFYGTWDGKPKDKSVNRWDSGLVGINHKPRPAYGILQKATAHLFRLPRRKR